MAASSDMNRRLDHLVGKRQELVRHVEAQRLGGPEVDHQLELGRLQDRQVGWLRAFEEAADVESASR
jgi:hypothetical protein